MLSRLPVAVAVAVVLGMAHTTSAAPLAPSDTPYTELVASRYTLPTVPPVAGWGVLPPDVVPVSSAAYMCLAPGVSCGFALVGAGGVVLATFSSAPRQVTTANVTYTHVVPTPSFGAVVAVITAPPPEHTLLAVVATHAVAALSCNVTTAACSTVASATPSPPVSGIVGAVVVGPPTSDGRWTAAVAHSRGLLAVSGSASAVSTRAAVSTPSPATAVAARPAVSTAPGPPAQVAFATQAKLYFLSPELHVQRWEWTTQQAQGWGAPIDGDNVTALAYDSCGALWVATPVAVDVVAINGTVSRITGVHGLPYNGSTALTPDPTTGGSMWVGSTHGVMQYAPASTCYEADLSRPGWRYLYGRRYLPSNATLALASGGAGTVLAVTDGGVALLQQQAWTLADKAAHYLAMVPLHDRDGFVADCSLGTPGNLSAVTCHVGESDGLWTSIVAAAEAFQYAVQPTAEALARVTRRTAALELLWNVTGIPGYMARTAGHVGQPGTAGNSWYNSTTMPGWAWQGNTSADEVMGHFFGLPAVVHHVGNASGQLASVVRLLSTCVERVVTNGYKLIGHDNLPTRWGIWDPTHLNDDRSWSDQRGLNSLQMLTMLRVAANVSGDPHGVLAAAVADLTSHANSYDTNMINLKIATAIDDNFSDDELAFLPFHSFFAVPSVNSTLEALATLGLTRLHHIVRGERSAAWSTIYGAATGDMDAVLVKDMVWSLQSWSLEQIDWDVVNSHRLDIRVNPEPDRDNHYGTQALRALPNNETPQYRLNANPYMLDGGSGGGRTFDPGAWLMAYYLGRLHGWL